MSVENQENKPENEKIKPKEEVKIEDFETVIGKFKEDPKFKEYINNIVSDQYKGLVNNKENLLKENVQLKEFRKKAQEDELTKLLLEGTEQSKAKAIEMLTADVLKPYQDLIVEKDEIIKTKQEFEDQIKNEREQKIISDIYNKLTLNGNIDDEAHKDILPVIYNNFKVVDGVVVFQGKDINKNGKPLSIEEFIIKYIDDGRKYYLKDKNGSNALFKNTTDIKAEVTPEEENYNQYLARMKMEAAAKRKR